MPGMRERPQAFAALVEFSARIGADPLLIQAAGGNTSIKDGDVMWIKASGTQLAEALDRDIFVAADWRRMRETLANDLIAADRPQDFVIGEGALRPSIETSLHAVFDAAVVIHAHCVSTIAQAVLEDGEARLAEKLADFDWAFVPYRKPGAQLAASVRAVMGPDTDVIVLGNHGLIVAADTVREAEVLLRAVVGAIALEPGSPLLPDMTRLGALSSDVFTPAAEDHILHQLALDPRSLGLATGGSLYPDHVIFLGVGAQALKGGADLKMHEQAGSLFLLIPGAGAVLRKDASSSARAMMRCLGDVVMRIPQDGVPHYLSLEENADLLDWDAEKYRQALNAG